MENLSTSALSMQILMLKMYNANLYSNAAHSVKSFSHAVSKKLSSYAEIDNNLVGILQPFCYLSANLECSSNNQVSQQIAIISTTYPIVFAEPSYTPENDFLQETVSLLNSLFALEMQTYQTLATYTTEPAANELQLVINILQLAAASRVRAIQIRELTDEIATGHFWIREEEIDWQCLQCGYITKSYAAQEECECCKGGQEFQSAVIV